MSATTKESDWRDTVAAPFKAVTRVVTTEPNAQEARQMMAEGAALYEAKNWAEAEQKFLRAAKLAPDSPVEEEALYFAGDCQFYQDRYSTAQNTFETLLKKYDRTRFLDRMGRQQFAIAQYWEQIQREDPNYTLVPNLTDKTRPLFDTPGNALEVYESIRLNDPTGPLADDSLMATANHYFLKGRYEDADYYYGLVLTEYPKSEHVAQASEFSLQSKLRKYQGPHYDVTPLDEAEKLADRILVGHPDLAAENRQRVAQMAAATKAQKAQVDYEMGVFYERKSKYGAARYWYNGVVREYADTPFAQMANERLEAIKDEPDHPPDRFWWLTNLFEGDKETY